MSNYRGKALEARFVLLCGLGAGVLVLAFVGCLIGRFT